MMQRSDGIASCNTGGGGGNSKTRESYRKKGYITPIDVFSIEEAAVLRGKYEAWVASLEPHETTHSHSVVVGDLRFRPHLFLPFVSDVVHHEKIVSVVREALGTTNVLLWSSDFNVKPPRSGGYFSLHQDATYTGLSPAEAGLTVWLALSDNVDAEGGCMTFVEGSHRHGQIPHIEGIGGGGRDGGSDSNRNDENNMLSRNQYVPRSATTTNNNGTGTEEFPAGGKNVSAALRAGQASLHHFHLLHESGPNRSDLPRIGLALRYVAAGVRQTGGVREAVTLVSGGETEHDGFDLEPVLPLNAAPADIARGREAHRDSMRRESANYFDDSKGAGAAKAYDAFAERGG